MAAAVPGVAGLVGRDGVVGRLHRLVDDAVAGRGSLTLLAGEPGAGKTAVLAATASYAASVGAACGQGAGWPGEGAPAYWPWRQVLRSLERSGAPAGTAGVLADAGGTDSHAAEAPSAARFRLHDTVTTALTTLARDRPLVVILDDLHWADEASVTLVEFLVPHLAATPMAVVGAYLDVGAPQVPALTRLTARADVVPLGGIATDAVARIVADAVGPDRADSVVADVVRRTGGNPFFVHQLCWLLAAGGSVGDVPPGVRGALEARFAAMDDDATDVQGLHEVLGAAAALGPRFEPALLDAVTRLPRKVVAAALHVALRHRILLDDAAAGGTGELRFAHDLVHEYAAALLPDDARAAVHAAVADTLLTRRAAGDDVPAARIAAHAVRADAHGERARRASVEAAREAASGLAYEDAVRHWSNALTAADGPGRRALLLELAAARRRAGDGEGARRDVLAAVAAARQAGDAAALARAALELHTLGTRAWWPPDELVQVLEEALRALGADPSDGALLLRARVLGALGRVLAWTGRDPVRGRDLATEAVDAARASGDPAAEAEALLALHNARWAPGTALERLALAEEILALADGLPGRVPAEILLEARLLRAGDQLELGDARFRTGLEDFVRRAEASGQPRWRHAALVRRAMLALLDGRQEDAERLIAGARDLGERIGEPGARDVWFDQMWDLRESQGRLGEMLERVEDFVADSGSPPARALRAFALLALGRRDDAVAEMAPVDVTGSPSDAATTGPPPAVHTAAHTATHTATHTAAHTAVVQAASGAALARALGATQVAEHFWPVLAPHATDTVVSGAVVTFKGAVAHHLGVLAVMVGRPDEARAHLERALAVHERLGATVWAQRTRRELAALQAAPGPDAGGVRPGFRRDGDHWTLSYAGAGVRLAHSKGLADLAVLVAAPGRAIRATDLMLAAEDPGNGHDGMAGGALRLGADEVLDATARRQLRARLADLDDEIAEAESWSDPERAARARDERGAILAELAAATGLGGRARRLGDQSERARKAVSGRIRDALGRIERVHPALAAHLRATVTTGTWCRYQPPPAIHPHP